MNTKSFVSFHHVLATCAKYLLAPEQHLAVRDLYYPTCVPSERHLNPDVYVTPFRLFQSTGQAEKSKQTQVR